MERRDALGLRLRHAYREPRLPSSFGEVRDRPFPIWRLEVSIAAPIWVVFYAESSSPPKFGPQIANKIHCPSERFRLKTFREV